MRASFWLLRPQALRALLGQVRLTARLLREPRVPAPLKIVPLGAALYAISPIDLLPDILPMLGQLDDIAVVAAALAVFVNLSPPSARQFHADAIAAGRPFSHMAPDDAIEAEWKRV